MISVSEQNTLMAESSKSWNISDTTSKLKPNQIFPAIPFPKINPVNLSRYKYKFEIVNRYFINYIKKLYRLFTVSYHQS